MKISIASVFLTAAIASNAVFAAAPQGKAFDNFLQVWFENQVRKYLFLKWHLYC
jgi:hypothetical protein